VTHVVEHGGRAGTRFNLWASSYANVTRYLVRSLGYSEGVDLFGAPYDWRLHLGGLEAGGQMDQLAARIERAVVENCGKRAILLGHSMGGLVATALLHRDPEWT
jgi:lysophospholipase-3